VVDPASQVVSPPHISEQLACLAHSQG